MHQGASDDKSPHVPQLYNPDDPREAVLERDPPVSPATMYALPSWLSEALDQPVPELEPRRPGAAGSPLLPPRSRLCQLFQSGLALNFKKKVRLWQCGYDGRCSSGITSVPEIARVNTVHVCKILPSDENYVYLHHSFPTSAGGLQDGGYVIHALLHLRREVADRELAGRIKRGRSGYKDELACPHGLGERHTTN